MGWRLCFSGSYTAMTRQDWLVMAISRKSILVVPNVRHHPNNRATAPALRARAQHPYRVSARSGQKPLAAAHRLPALMHRRLSLILPSHLRPSTMTLWLTSSRALTSAVFTTPTIRWSAPTRYLPAFSIASACSSGTSKTALRHGAG